MNKQQVNKVNDAVISYLKTKDKKYVNIYMEAVIPIVRLKALTTCAGSTKWDSEELYSILLEDAWRLFKIYVPKEGQKFHYLLLHQLNNKTINYIKNTTGKIYKVCSICGEHANDGDTQCVKCKSSLQKPWIFIESSRPKSDNDTRTLSDLYSHTPDYLQEMKTRDKVKKVLDSVRENDHKTYKILIMLMEGYSKSEISEELNGLAQNAINNRIRKCAKILNRR